MVIVDEKAMLPNPPPPYVAAGPLNPPPFPAGPRTPTTLATLPAPLLLRIVYELFPHRQVENQRKVLYWLTLYLRLVSRSIYVACMHVLRSTYLPAYAELIRPPYTTDPFPSDASYVSDSIISPIQSLYRELHVLDLFLTVKAREDVWSDQTELHLEREELIKDIFDLMQPRARLEDLVRVYGIREGVVALSPAHQAAASGSTVRIRLPEGVRPVQFSLLSVSFSPRRVGLVLTTKERKRTIVDVPRAREESLESSARQLVKQLKVWLFGNAHHSNGVR